MEVEQSDRQRAPDFNGGCGRWPARTQRLIGEIRSRCRGWLHEPLMLCLGDFDRRLYDKSDRTRSHLDQQRYLATRQRLLEERQTFEDRFIGHIDQAFVQMGTVRAPASPTRSRPALSLVDPLEHELTTALDQLVARNEARCGPLLVELSYRLAVLVGAPPLEAEALPLGPQAIATAFRDASAALSLPSDHHLLLLQSLESTLIQGLAPLYEIINSYLQADGILPQLRAFPLPRSTPRRPRSAPSTTPIAQKTAAEAATARSEPDAALDNLREPLALQSLDNTTTAESSRGETSRAATADELQAALRALQQRLSEAFAPAGGALSGAQRVREALLDQCNIGQPSAMRVRLSAAQDHTVELIARLFEQLHQQLPPHDPTHALFEDLQLPLLRMALLDRHVFDRRDHPARLLLDNFTEAAHDWLDDSDSDSEADRALRGQLKQLTDHANREPPSSDLYSSLLTELEQHLTQLQHKAQLAERRHMEAMQGHERLDQARRRATELMAERFALSPPRGLLRDLLEHAWSDVLALTLLRHGEQSETFGKRLLTTDQLLGRLPSNDRQELQATVETGLQQIGVPAEEAGQMAQRLIGAGEHDPATALLSATDLALRLKQRQRLGEPPSPTPSADSGSLATDPREQSIEQHLRKLSLGGWFEFADPATGRVAQRKLAWYSPRSGRCLLVSRRGQRGEEMNLAQLAHEMAGGRVREVSPGDQTPLDRAWRGVTDTLPQPVASLRPTGPGSDGR